MADQITVVGVVATDPRVITTRDGLGITSFRLAATHRYFDRAAGKWAEGGTNWYTVSAFRNLAFNANASLRKGEHVVVHGRLKQRPWQAGDKSGVAIEIEADAIGHDLSWGMTQLQRLEPPRRDEAKGADAADHREGDDAGDADATDADAAVAMVEAAGLSALSASDDDSDGSTDRPGELEDDEFDAAEDEVDRHPAGSTLAGLAG